MTVGNSDAYNSETFIKYYGKQKTYRTYGICVAQYIGKSLLLNVNITRMLIVHKKYEHESQSGLYFAFSAKYNF